jgi:hypothetical protein
MVCGGVASGLETLMPLVPNIIAGSFALLLASLASCVPTFSQNRAASPNDSVDAQLATLGERGIAIAVAREKVLEILQAENSCSAWFRQADPDPPGVFKGLHFALDPHGPSYIIGSRADYGQQLFKHPYAASVLENAGRGAVITLNAHGPFFVGAAEVLEQDLFGVALRPAGWRSLLIETYTGNTLAAQMTTLLHELGHVVGRIPADFDESSGQSGRNTAEVLHYCRPQIKASMRADRAVVIRVGDLLSLGNAGLPTAAGHEPGQRRE